MLPVWSTKGDQPTVHEQHTRRMVLLSGWKLLTTSSWKRQGSALGRCHVHKTKKPSPSHEGSRSGSHTPFVLAVAAVGITSAGCFAKGPFNEESDKFRFFGGFTNLSKWFEFARLDTMVTRMDYLEHDPEDYDIYIQNPKASDLPYLLHQFQEHGKEVWPWIWCHPNEAGPHFVFVGVNCDTLDAIRRLRAKSNSYNILLIASEKEIRDASTNAGDPNIYETTHCGIVSDASLELLNVQAKILMLSDERVIAFDSLTIV